MAPSLKCYAEVILPICLVISFSQIVLADDIWLEGGEATVDDASPKSYGRPLANLTAPNDFFSHQLGERGFNRNFRRVKIEGRTVLGPKFNHVSCLGCHPGGGRGAPVFGRSTSQAVVKVSSVRGRHSLPGGPFLVSGIGTQLRDHALINGASDGRLKLLWDLVRGYYSDGEAFELRTPALKRSGTSGNLPAATIFSLRRPPPVFGAGLLEAVDEQELQLLADSDDLNHDGISGRINLVWSIRDKAKRVGRFGFKAATSSVLQQVAGAYAIDMGVSNHLFHSGEGGAEIDKNVVALTTFYVQTLAVPRARDQNEPEVAQGMNLFKAIGCSGCHIPTLRTRTHPMPELSNQVIHPFSDLLLHDMGEGLSDGRSEFQASGSEWRTTPLWGIGLAQVVLGKASVTYLHDGRARSLEEAILWHGGEAQKARDTFLILPRNDRDILIRFLHSL